MSTLKSKSPVQKLKNRRIVTRLVALPIKLVEDIKALGLEHKYEMRCYQLIDHMLRINRKKKRDSFNYVHLSQNYLIKVLKETYLERFLKTLKAEEIIVCDEKWIFGDYGSKTKKYKLNERYAVETEYVTMAVKETIPWEEYVKFRKTKEEYRNNMKGLDIDPSRLRKISEERVEQVKIENFKRNEEIPQGVIEVCLKNGNYERPKYMSSVSKSLAVAQKYGLSLIQDGSRYYIQKEEDFIRNKKYAIRQADEQSICELERGYFRASVNDTNGRLDTNLTNLSGVLVEDIIKRNNLVEIDLSNSQFAILCHVMQDRTIGPDFELFKKLAVTGELYEFIQEKLGLPSRKEAKQLTFELLFSSHQNRSPLLKKLREYFPNVLTWITEYKRLHGDNQFAIMLQRKESEIFVEHLLPTLQRDFGFCLTKHDCVIVRKEDEKQVREYIQMFFDSIEFEGKLK
jgi:hypothetical protein